MGDILVIGSISRMAGWSLSVFMAEGLGRANAGAFW